MITRMLTEIVEVSYSLRYLNEASVRLYKYIYV
jgi:hypothetical protein